MVEGKKFLIVPGKEQIRNKYEFEETRPFNFFAAFLRNGVSSSKGKMKNGVKRGRETFRLFQLISEVTKVAASYRSMI